ncbi:MAG TPA: hypothetical protein VKN14_03945 [Flavobacteriaceae bacterium]|nr:hypothetical protein [Flavobacteriaceae bacterium]
MIPFRSEIRNLPKQQTIKIYLSDESLDLEIKKFLETFEDIDRVEINESVGRNRGFESITVFKKDNVDINTLRIFIEKDLKDYFENGDC